MSDGRAAVSDGRGDAETLPGILALLADLESRFPINDWKVDGIRLWPLVRVILSFRASLVSGAPPSWIARAGGAARRAGMIADAWLTRWRDRRASGARTARAEAFFLGYSLARQSRVRGRHFDIFEGPLQLLLEERGIPFHAWEYSQFAPYRRPRAGISWPIQSELLSLQIRNRRPGRPPGRFELPHYPEFERVLRGRGLLHPQLEERNLRRRASLMLSLRDLFRSALKAIDPCIAFTSNMGPFEFALHLACHEHGIPGIEIQHGAQGELNSHYAGWTRVPPEGYELLPFGFWNWEDGDARTINRWSARCAPRHQGFVGGNPWHELCRRLGPNDVDPAYARLLEPSEDRRILLVTLQPAEKRYDTVDPLPGLVADAIRRSDPGWEWWIRFHPVDRPDHARIRSLIGPTPVHVESKGPTELPLHLLLRRVDLHLTHSSSVVLDAQRAGVYSIVWSEFGAAFHERLIRAGDCMVATTDLATAIRAALKKERRPPAAHDDAAGRTLEHFMNLGRKMRDAR